MNLGNSLFQARKKNGLSQEETAERLGVSRQTISKWETNETVPDIYQSKKMAKIYHISLDELFDFDLEIKEIQEQIDKADEKAQAKIDWTKAWSKKYPILVQYRQKVNVPHFAFKLNAMLDELKESYQLSEQDAVLVLKDILYTAWKVRKNT
ncbi:MAG: helix-turn-helix transcriptional regulator [Oscillospiraceae bacterium]|nr:helix-turn-helix transcriptional regulator [Oscillospiraceae bacterium]